MSHVRSVLGQGFSMFKEKSSAALEAAKSSSAGTAVAGGLNRAATAGSEQIGKLKETEAYKKSSALASSSLERTSVVASGALEKVRSHPNWIALCVCVCIELFVVLTVGSRECVRGSREGQGWRVHWLRDDQVQGVLGQEGRRLSALAASVSQAPSSSY